MLKSWQTTLSGIAAIGAGTALLIWGDKSVEIIAAGTGLIATGIGLMRARDNHVPSEQAGAK